MLSTSSRLENLSVDRLIILQVIMELEVDILEDCPIYNIIESLSRIILINKKKYYKLYSELISEAPILLGYTNTNYIKILGIEDDIDNKTTISMKYLMLMNWYLIKNYSILI